MNQKGQLLHRQEKHQVWKLDHLQKFKIQTTEIQECVQRSLRKVNKWTLAFME